MFKFDFNVDVEKTSHDNTDAIFKDNLKEHPACNSSADCIEEYDSREILLKDDILEKLDLYELSATELAAGNEYLSLIVSGFLQKDDEFSKDIQKAEQNHTDLIPGVYEGGAKIWECTEDLLKYIAKEYIADDWQSKYILDLGCGAGLLGIYAYLWGAKVCFQDYNEDVLETITIPNFLLNAKKDKNKNPLDLKKLNTVASFYSGDWTKFTSRTQNDKKFDFILTSETIYNPNNHRKLLETFDAKLKPEGIVLLAAKTYYFGVGGGLRQFEELVLQDGRFKSRILFSTSEGLSREIIELSRLEVLKK